MFIEDLLSINHFKPSYLNLYKQLQKMSLSFMLTTGETKAWTGKMTYPESGSKMEGRQFEANCFCLQSPCSSFYTACLSLHTDSTS